jgi:hypothetical protein
MGLDDTLAPSQISDGSTGTYQTSGSGAPATTPASIGIEYYDTANKKFYKSFGTASAADWVEI